MQTLTTYNTIRHTDYDVVANDPTVINSKTFGQRISMNETYLVINYNYDPQDGDNARFELLIYKNTGNGYNLYDRLRSTGTNNKDYFPQGGLTFNGQILALFDRSNDQVCIYKDNGLQFNLIQTIDNPNTGINDGFGSSGFLHDDYLFVGAQAYDGSGTNSGVVYVYTHDIGGDTYSYSFMLEPDELTTKDLFGGGKIFYDGTYLYVGMGRDDDSGTNAGCVFIFEKQSSGNLFSNNSSGYYKININDFLPNDSIGQQSRTEIQGDFIYCATIEDGVGQGEVYVFKKDSGSFSWSLKTKLINHIDNSITILPKSEFGREIDLYEDYVVVPARYYNYDNQNYGGVFIFKRDNVDGTSFTHKYTLLLSTTDQATGEDFGWGIGMNKNTVYVSARDYDDSAVGDDKGAVFEYELSEYPILANSSSSPLTSLTTDQTLISHNIANSNEFGKNFSVRGNYMCVMDNYFNYHGLLHIYKFSNGQYTRLNGLTEPSITENISNTTASFFGEYSDINDDWVVVGLTNELFDTNDSGTENQQGAVVVYKIVNDTYDTTRYSVTNTDGYQVLFPTTTNNSMLFGSFCSIDGNYTAVGAPYMDNTNTNDGSVYVFQLSSGVWSQMQKIDSPNSENEGYFGSVCIVRGDYLLIGAWNEDVDGNTGEGRAYLYYNNSGTWTHWYTLQMANGGATDKFAFQGAVSMDITTGYAVIGAYNNTTATGKIYIYNDITTEPGTKPTLKTEDTAIIGSSSTTNEEFGRSVCVDGSVIVVGSPADDDNGTNVGRVYIYYNTGTEWLEYAKFQNSTLENGEKFGTHVGKSGSNIVVSSPYKDVSGTTNAGEIYLFIDEICFLKGTLIKTKDGYKCIEELKRGDYIYVKNNDFEGYKQLNRLVVSPGSTRKYIRFNKNSIDTIFEDLYITCGHPVYYNNDYYNPEDFANNNNYDVEYIELSPKLLYTLQFEEHYNIIANGMYVTSLPPYTNYKNKHLPKELYFNPEKFDEDNIGKMYPPYMLHDDPLPIKNIQ